MADDEQIYDDSAKQPDDSNEDDANVPASVAFVEMMRQAATPPVDETAARPAQQTPHASPAQNPAEQAGQGRAAAMEAQRIQRVKRRAERKQRQPVGVIGGLLRAFFVVIVAGGIIATIFTWWTPTGLLSDNVRDGLSVAQATATSQLVAAEATALPTPRWLRRIGVIAGHRGPENDPGAVCPDGLTEVEITFNIAQQVVRNLQSLGFAADLLDEFDPRLNDYEAEALISIHANTCQDFGELVSGFLIAQAAARPTGGLDTILVECVADYYRAASGLQRGAVLTRDMTEYHTFREIHPHTAAAIIELGYMLADRELLTGQPETLSKAITDGLLCYLEPGDNPLPVAASGS